MLLLIYETEDSFRPRFLFIGLIVISSLAVFIIFRQNPNMKNKLICYCFLTLNQFCLSQDTEHSFNSNSSDSLDHIYSIPIYQTDGADAENDLSAQDASSLLQSSRDLYSQVASFQFGSARFALRGYASKNHVVMINGVIMNNPETGSASWASWGGLNDVTRYTETRIGNVNNIYGFSAPGGYTNIDSKASSFKKGSRFSYANANRIFRHRFMLTHSSGLSKSGWAISMSVSTRTGNELIIPGTYLKAASFYISIDKKLNAKHLFSFTGFYTPSEKATASAATKEVYALSESNYYNANWGYQNGEVRNSSISTTNKPVFIVSHIFTPKLKSKLSTSLMYTFGKSSFSGTNFYNSTNSRPDYYKYLPSYYYLQKHYSEGDSLQTKWQTDVNTSQIDWNKMIAANQANLYTLPSEFGQTPNTTETRARYIIENRIENLNQLVFNLVYNERKERFFLSVGCNGTIYRNEKYKTMEDLLGATFWIDVDQFAQNLGVDPMIQQNDIENPDKKIFKGDKFGYDYFLNINKAELWGQAEYTFKKLDWYAGISFSESVIWREGLVANGKFPESSKGNSIKLFFLNYGFKAGLTYKINGRNFFTANTQILTRPPEAANTFISPRVRNDVVDDIKSEGLLSFDVNYLAKFPFFKMRFTLYSTQLSDQTWLRTYWHDEYNNNANVIMTNVNTKHSGVELGIEKILLAKHYIQFVFGFAQSLYSNQPKLQAWLDNNNSSLYYNRKVYLKNYRLGNSPQLISSIAYKFTGKKNWFAGFSFNYVDQIYIAANPDRRTTDAAGKFQENEKELAESITGQDRLPAYFFSNANAGKSFRLGKKNYLNLNFSVNNLLNNTQIITMGYEQLRWNAQQIEQFPNKYYYMPGITYMVLLNLSF